MDSETCEQCGQGRFWRCDICNGCEYCCMDDRTRSLREKFRSAMERIGLVHTD